MQWPRSCCSAYSLDCDYSKGHGPGLGWHLPVLLRHRRRRQHLRLPRAPLARGGPAVVDRAASGPHRGGRRGRPRPGLSQDGPEPAWPRIARRHRQLHGRSGAGRARRGPGAGRGSPGVARSAGYRSMQFNAVVETNTGAVHLWQALGSRSSPRCRRLSTTASTDWSARTSCSTALLRTNTRTMPWIGRRPADRSCAGKDGAFCVALGQWHLR